LVETVGLELRDELSFKNIGRNSTAKIRNFFRKNAKHFASKFLTVTEKLLKNETTSFTYDVNEHV